MKNSGFLLALSLLLLMVACKNNTLEEVQPENNPTFEPDMDKKEILVKMGFDEYAMQEFADYFIIDNDFVIQKAAITPELINPL